MSSVSLVFICFALMKYAALMGLVLCILDVFKDNTALAFIVIGLIFWVFFQFFSIL